jgi:hypothetical protein
VTQDARSGPLRPHLEASTRIICTELRVSEANSFSGCLSVSGGSRRSVPEFGLQPEGDPDKRGGDG